VSLDPDIDKFTLLVATVQQQMFMLKDVFNPSSYDCDFII